MWYRRLFRYITFITETIGELQYALDGLQQFMQKHQKDSAYPDIFDRGFLSKLVKCINYIDPKLLLSVNAQWKGFKTYATSGGVPGNGTEWKQCHEKGTSDVRS